MYSQSKKVEEGEGEGGPFRASRGGDVEVKQLLI